MIRRLQEKWFKCVLEVEIMITHLQQMDEVEMKDLFLSNLFKVFVYYL